MRCCLSLVAYIVIHKRYIIVFDRPGVTQVYDWLRKTYGAPIEENGWTVHHAQVWQSINGPLPFIFFDDKIVTAVKLIFGEFVVKQ